MRPTRAWRRDRERGASAVEFALVAPVLFLLVFGIVDFGFGFSAALTISNASREGARLAAVDTDPARVRAVVAQGTTTLNASDLIVTVGCSTPAGPACPGGLPGAKAGDKAVVTVQYDYRVMTPVSMIVGSMMRLQSTSTMRIE